MDLSALLSLAVKSNASDLHLSAGMPPLIRVDGVIQRIDMEACEAEQIQSMLYERMNDLQREQFERLQQTDFAIALPPARFRVNVFQQLHGPAAVFRVISGAVATLEEINAPPVFNTLAMKHKGLILVTGATGCGKSTTLAALVNCINQQRKAHILTIEDPIEFVHTAKNCVINQRELNQHTTSFDAALRSALRADPDVILVGEMRDLETIRLALTAAETGHLVLATLHTTSAAKSIDRIIDAFPGNEKDMIRAMLAESLQAVIAQTLLAKPQAGRVAAWEIMLGTTAIRNLIRENKTPQMYSVMQTSRAQGMQTMEQCLLQLVEQQQISMETAEQAMDKLKLKEI